MSCTIKLKWNMDSKITILTLRTANQKQTNNKEASGKLGLQKIILIKP